MEDETPILENPEFGLGPDEAHEAAGEVEVQPEPTLEEIYARIAALVRENAQAHGRPTDIASIEALIPPAEPNAPPLSLEEMVRDEQYADIMPAFTAGGDVYLFSNAHISAEEAMARSEIEALQSRVAERVRSDSASLAQLTPVKALDLPDNLPGFSIESMLQDERYADLRTLTIASGEAFLFSETYVTENYAKLLGRAAAKDPVATIVETVRDDSRIYPRPTKLSSFEETLFGIDSAELDSTVERILTMPEHADIKKLVASNGAVYLFSDQHMQAAQAEYLVEWDAVLRHSNP